MSGDIAMKRSRVEEGAAVVCKSLGHDAVDNRLKGRVGQFSKDDNSVNN